MRKPIICSFCQKQGNLVGYARNIHVFQSNAIVHEFARINQDGLYVCCFFKAIRPLIILIKSMK